MKRISLFLLIKMAFHSLQRHPFRMCLALLGIVIGITALLTTIGIGKGADDKIQKTITAFGKDIISLYSGNRFSEEAFEKHPICYDDYQIIRTLLADKIEAVVPVVQERFSVRSGSTQVIGTIKGSTYEYAILSPKKLQEGHALNAFHDAMGSKVIILGFEVAKELFGNKNPVGEIVFIENSPFKVIGFFQPQEVSLSYYNPNLESIVPFSSVWKKLIRVKGNAVQEIILRPKDREKFPFLISQLTRLMRFHHNLSKDQIDDFTIIDRKMIVEAAKKSSRALNSFLLTAAASSLLVGGIGIMNVMLVAMTERKKEIGLKMAIGASPHTILIQFLIESILLCMTGGIIGIVVGYVTLAFVGYITEVPWLIEWYSIVTALGTTVGIGIFFGFYPAYRVSKLNPIRALQST